TAASASCLWLMTTAFAALCRMATSSRRVLRRPYAKRKPCEGTSRRARVPPIATGPQNSLSCIEAVKRGTASFGAAFLCHSTRGFARPERNEEEAKENQKCGTRA